MLRTLSISIFFLLFGEMAMAQHQLNTEWLRNDSELHQGHITERMWVDRQMQVLDDIMENPGQGVIKCVTPLYIKAQKLGLTEDLNQERDELIRRKSASQNYLSESGLFRIYYFNIGSDAVPQADENANGTPDYVEWIAEAADSSYRHEILTLGFRDPIPAGAEYSVFVANLGFYGLTRIVRSEPAGTVIEIENDFAGFPENTDPEGNQKGAVKVTMAHEFKHAIQYVQNGWRGDSDLWAEMDATLYEELVYDNVNDYYNYLGGFASNLFIAPQVSIIPGSYEDITWALYFHDRYGDAFWTEVWEEIEPDPVQVSLFDAMRTVFEQYPESYEEAVLEAATWHFASGPDFSVPGYGFDESNAYPAPRLRARIDSLQEELSTEYLINRYAAAYFEVDPLEPATEFVQFNYVSSSENVQFGLLGYDRQFNTPRYQRYQVTTVDQEEQVRLNWSWSDLDRLGVVVFNHSFNSTESFQFRVSDYFPTSAQGIQLAQNYPNPFNPQTTIRVTLPSSVQVKLEIYDPLGRLVRVLRDGVMPAGINEVVFDGQDLASGVYIYRLESSEGVQMRKMLLLK